MLVALCFFHALSLGRRKFGFQGFSRSYPFNNGDLTVCAQVVHNYLEGNEAVPWDDVRYNLGEVMYGGHITDPWDRRITSTYLDILLQSLLKRPPLWWHRLLAPPRGIFWLRAALPLSRGATEPRGYSVTHLRPRGNRRVPPPTLPPLSFFQHRRPKHRRRLHQGHRHAQRLHRASRPTRD